MHKNSPAACANAALWLAANPRGPFGPQHNDRVPTRGSEFRQIIAKVVGDNQLDSIHGLVSENAFELGGERLPVTVADD